MGGFKDKWKTFLTGRMDRAEARRFLHFLFTKDGEKEMESGISEFMDQKEEEGYESEIASVIENFKKRNQRHAVQASKNKNHWPGKGLLIWAACIGSAIMMVYHAPGFLSGFNETQSDGENLEKAETVIKSNGRGQKSKILMTDGSIIYLNASSELSYSRNFSHNRVVRLTGEAYFEVANDSLNPFRVITGEIETVALGTAFNINAYREEQVQVALASGKVLVEHQENRNSVFLNPGQSTEFQPEGGKLKVLPVDTHKISLWKEGILYFEKKPFPDLIPLLENWYNVDIEIRGTMPDDRCTGRFEKKEYLSNVLKVLEHSIGFSFEIEGSKVIIYN
ncbi:FecR family protein [Cyclobacterium lianum]|uniref:FecR family protein n=1 Tax=Cyclobacterium lianum TaxID=388280 RepID=A0A1M7L6L6_9BACT|nr:FecR domain-containing protein [Cyclobacterium lianum]SHM73400.1 FecR family protein [Cyclobacterium lianum]